MGWLGWTGWTKQAGLGGRRAGWSEFVDRRLQRNGILSENTLILRGVFEDTIDFDYIFIVMLKDHLRKDQMRRWTDGCIKGL